MAILDTVQTALVKRFKCLETNDVLVKAQAIMDPRKWPRADDLDNLAVYGNEEIKVK